MGCRSHAERQLAGDLRPWRRPESRRCRHVPLPSILWLICGSPRISRPLPASKIWVSGLCSVR